MVGACNYRDGLGDLELCRRLAGLFDPIHDRWCFNCIQAGSIPARAFDQSRHRLSLMGHENRQLRMRENMAGCAAEDHLAKSALGVGPLDEKIGMECRRIFEDGFAC
jgi:hypothetical protein